MLLSSIVEHEEHAKIYTLVEYLDSLGNGEKAVNRNWIIPTSGSVTSSNVGGTRMENPSPMYRNQDLVLAMPGRRGLRGGGGEGGEAASSNAGLGGGASWVSARVAGTKEQPRVYTTDNAEKAAVLRKASLLVAQHR